MSIETTAKIICDRCNRTEDLELPTLLGGRHVSKPHEFPKGWTSQGVGVGKHLCPDCTSQRDDLVKRFNAGETP